MTDATFPLPRHSAGANALAETLSLMLGAGVTLLLFIGVAHFDGQAPAALEPDLTELHVASLPPEIPPPRPVETPQVVTTVLPFAGLETGANASPVRIAVVPPDLSRLLPVDTIAPAAKIEAARLYTDLKPRIEISEDTARIYQSAEVDQRPAALSRPKPYIPPIVRNSAKSLRVFVVVLIDTHGTVKNVRVLESSGNPYFDAIIVRDIQDAWIFSPAVKNGQKVRCLIQQNVRVEWVSSSHFETN
jgi:TonB family protein